jgi:hypothetical protein
MKICPKCDRELPLESFNNYHKTKDGKQAYCRDCAKAFLQARRAENAKEIDKATWQKRKADPANFAKRKEANRKWRENNPDTYKAIWKRTNRQYKEKVLAKVAGDKGLKCDNCGCDRIEFLEVNHKNGGGAKEYKHGGNNKKLYAAILNGDRPTDDLNILCKPCNNLHYLELKFGPQPYKIIWQGEKDVKSVNLE